MCKFIGCILCLGALGAAGFCAWRFGPWYNQDSGDPTNTSNEPTFTALNTCDGCCNGLVSNCERKINDVLIPMVHNAHSSKADLFLAYNNNKDAEEALVAGYRGLMLDSCMCDGSIGETIQSLWKGEMPEGYYMAFCHGTCDAGIREPMELLGNIKKFLDTNRNEVLIIEFEIRENSLVELYKAIDNSGLDEYVFRSDSTDISEWPTLQSLIDANSRLLLFAHGDGMESCTTMSCPEGLFYTYDHFQQTNWNDNTCNLKGNPTPSERGFLLMNHWINNERDLPSEKNAKEFNTFDSLLKRFKLCKERLPSVVAVDFWDVGDVLSFVKEVNLNRGGGDTTAAEAIAHTQGK